MEYVLAAFTFGLIAGLKPGPMGIYIIEQTMRYGLLSGFRASLAPFVSDGPIIVFTLLISMGVKAQDDFVAIISIVGGLDIGYLAIKIAKNNREINLNSQRTDYSGFWTSVKINLLNPSPYLFWLTIGGSYIVAGTLVEALLFVIVALSVLCATKFVVATLVFTMGKQLSMTVYSMFLRALAVPLLYFSISLIFKGFVELR